MKARDFPASGSGDWSQWYSDLKGRGETTIMDISRENGVIGTTTTVFQMRWGQSAQNIVLQDLVGCVGIIAVSHLGTFFFAKHVIRAERKY
jgi:hypothetical protein